MGLKKLVMFCAKKITELLSYKIRPVFVFDGGRLPMKKDTEDKRRKNRKARRKEADELFAKGDKEAASK